MSEPTFAELDAMVIAAMRHQGRHMPHLTDATWEKFIVWASPKRLLGRRDDVRGVGLVWDDPRTFPPQDRRYDVGVPILPEDVEKIEPPVFLLVTLPGEYLKVTHEGPYDQVPATYDEAMDVVMPQHGLDMLAAPIIEVYRNSPAEVLDEELRTDIYIPVIRS